MRIIEDLQDGVTRCPRCAWELEEGMCGQCGFPESIDSMDESSVYDYSDYDSENAEEIMSITGQPMDFELPFDEDGESLPSYRSTSPDHHHEHLPALAGGYSAARRARIIGAARRELARMRQNHNLPGSGPRPIDGQEAGSDTDSTITDEYDSLPEDEEGPSDDETAGSLENFVVNDQVDGEDLPTELPDTRMSEPDDENQVNAFDFDLRRRHHYNSNHRRSPAPRVHLGHSTTSGFSSDEPSDHSTSPDYHETRRRDASMMPDSEDSDIVIPSQRPRQRLHSRTDRRTQSNRPRAMTMQTEHRTSSDGSSQDLPIEIASDSDDPVPLSRSRRRAGHAPPARLQRRAPAQVLSDGESGENEPDSHIDLQSSNGTVTMEGASVENPRDEEATEDGWQGRALLPSSPGAIDTSPERDLAPRNSALSGRQEHLRANTSARARIQHPSRSNSHLSPPSNNRRHRPSRSPSYLSARSPSPLAGPVNGATSGSSERRRHSMRRAVKSLRRQRQRAQQERGATRTS